MKKIKYITLADFYRSYPYKCRDINSSTIPMNPYFPKKEIDCNNKYSLTRQEWFSIINCYLKHLTYYIVQGNIYRLKRRLGVFQIVKYKGNPKPDWSEYNKTKRIVYNNSGEAMGYDSAVKWYRNTNCSLAMRWFWIIWPLPTFRKIKSNFIQKDYSTNILKYRDL